MNVRKMLTIFTIVFAVQCVGVPAPASAQIDTGIRVVVDNHSFWDVHVYVAHDGVRRSLGLATGLSGASFEIPRSLANEEIRLIAEPVGPEGAFVSDVFFPRPRRPIQPDSPQLSRTVHRDRQRPASLRVREGGRRLAP